MLAAGSNQVTGKARPKVAAKRGRKTAKRSAAARMAFSLTRYGRELGVSRDRLALLLTRVDATPIDNGVGHVSYRLRDVLKALAGGNELEKMSPFERKAYWEGVHAEHRAMEHAKKLMRVEDFEAELARVVRIVIQGLELLPDTIERDTGAPGPVVTRIEQAIDDLRRDLHACLGEEKLEHFVEGKAREAAVSTEEASA